MVGIGPGGRLERTYRAEEAISASQVVVGYTKYLALVEDLVSGKEVISSGMTRERERCQAAVERAEQGDIVALISSGDPGIYGMAGLALEMSVASGQNISIEIVPGVTAASATAARLGAPLMLDFACISLSDILVPWNMIRQRLEAVASADLVTALYNPRSKKRRNQLEEAAAIFLRHRAGKTSVGIGTAVGTGQERIELATLDNFLHLEISMRSVVIIGNSTSRLVGDFFVTPRGYNL